MSIRYLPDSPPPPQTRRSSQVWASARADYLAGGSAAEVCERHQLPLSTFRYRANVEGWRRMDQPESPADSPFTAPALAEDTPPAEEPPLLAPAAMSDRAWNLAERALAKGRLIEARGWLRLYRDMADAQALRTCELNMRKSDARRAALAEASRQE